MTDAVAPTPFPFPEHLQSFPPDFLFGTATAAYQIEGAVNEGGRGVSIWDTFSHTPGRTHRGDNGDVACDHYHRWEADLDLMAELGYGAYRLSLSWTRLQPSGSGALNQEAVSFYLRLLEGCRQRDITPLVTLYHWDLPQPLQDAGGWPSRQTAYRFADYAARCVEAFGHLCQRWITINEPWCATILSHALGEQAPGFTNDALAVRSVHHVLLAHGLALAEFRRLAPELQVGITNIVTHITPATQRPEDIEAARVLDITANRLFLEPCYLGRYSDETVAVFAEDGLHADEREDGLVQPGDFPLISAPADFAGINHYQNNRALIDPRAWRSLGFVQVEPTPTSFGWSNTPDALFTVIRRVATEFTDLPIYITENGAAFDDYADPSGEVRDPERIDYLNGYIDAVGAAITAGTDVRGYMAWSFLDNFEWAWGYGKRFGLVFVDFASQRRTPKSSARWYSELIARHRRLHA